MIYEFTDPKFEEYIAASTEATLIIQECVVTQSQRSLSNDFLTSGFFLTSLGLEHVVHRCFGRSHFGNTFKLPKRSCDCSVIASLRSRKTWFWFSRHTLSVLGLALYFFLQLLLLQIRENTFFLSFFFAQHTSLSSLLASDKCMC